MADESSATFPVDPVDEDTLHSEENISLMIGKVAALESFLNLATKNCSFEEFVREVLVTIMNAVNSEAGSILELDQNNNSFFFRAVVGSSSDQLMAVSIPSGQGIVGHVAESKMPVVIDDVSDNRIHLGAISKVVEFEARNLAALPIVIRGRMFGVLELLNRMGEKTFTSSDVEFLTYLCDMASKTIEIRLMIAWSRAQFGEATQGLAA